MYDSTTAVTIGLDVHARSIRLAAVRADELLEERTRIPPAGAVARPSVLGPARFSHDSNGLSSAARQGKAATTSWRACAHTCAARLGREPAQGADSAPTTVPARARRDGAWAK